jgi:hypothetical protein
MYFTHSVPLAGYRVLKLCIICETGPFYEAKRLQGRDDRTMGKRHVRLPTLRASSSQTLQRRTADSEFACSISHRSCNQKYSNISANLTSAFLSPCSLLPRHHSPCTKPPVPHKSTCQTRFRYFSSYEVLFRRLCTPFNLV